MCPHTKIIPPTETHLCTIHTHTLIQTHTHTHTLIQTHSHHHHSRCSDLANSNDAEWWEGDLALPKQLFKVDFVVMDKTGTGVVDNNMYEWGFCVVWWWWWVVCGEIQMWGSMCSCVCVCGHVVMVFLLLCWWRITHWSTHWSTGVRISKCHWSTHQQKVKLSCDYLNNMKTGRMQWCRCVFVFVCVYGEYGCVFVCVHGCVHGWVLIYIYFYTHCSHTPIDTHTCSHTHTFPPSSP